MHPGQNLQFAGYRPDLVHLAAVDPAALLQYHPAHLFLLDTAHHLGDLALQFGELIFQVPFHLGQQVGIAGFPLHLVGDVHNFVQRHLDPGLYFIDQGLLDHGRSEFPLGHTGRGGNLGDQIDYFDYPLAGEPESSQHHFLRQFLGSPLHHHDRLPGAGYDQIELGGFKLVPGGIKHVIAIDVSHPHGGNLVAQRYLAQRHGRRDADEAEDVGRVLLVGAEHGHHYYHVVVVTVREQRPDRPVDQAGAEHFTVAGTPLALEKSARNLAPGESAFAVVDEQGQKVDTLFGVRAFYHSGQHRGLSVLKKSSPVGLFGHPAGFQREFPAADNFFNPMNHHFLPNL